MSLWSSELERSVSVSPGPHPGMNLHGDRMLVPTAGMAEKEALDSTAGCISVIQESFELGAWNAAADGGLRLLGQVSAKGASVHPVKKACFQCWCWGAYETLAGEQSQPLVLSLSTTAAGWTPWPEWEPPEILGNSGRKGEALRWRYWASWPRRHADALATKGKIRDLTVCRLHSIGWSRWNSLWGLLICLVESLKKSNTIL